MIINWDRLYRKQTPAMLGMCRRYISSEQEAEDVLHDAIVHAINKQNTYRGIGSAEGWLRKIVLNQVLMHLRNKKRLGVTFTDLDDGRVVNNTDDGTSYSYGNLKVDQGDLLRMIDDLPEHHRTVFNLYVFEKYKHKQISDLLGITENTSKSHLIRARKSLQIKIDEQYGVKRRKKRAGIVPLFVASGCSVDNLFRDGLGRFVLQPGTSFIMPATSGWALAAITVKTAVVIFAIVGTIAVITPFVNSNADSKSVDNSKLYITDTVAEFIHYPDTTIVKRISKKSATLPENSICINRETKKDSTMNVLQVAAFAALTMGGNDTVTDIQEHIDTVVVNNNNVQVITDKPNVVSQNTGVIKHVKINKVMGFDEANNGWAKFESAGQYGFINKKAEVVVPAIYSRIYDYHLMRTNWALVERDGMFGFLNSYGKEIVNCNYTKIYDYNINKRGWALVRKDELYGFIDLKGNEVVEPQYKEISDFNIQHSDWAMVLKNDLYGFIDSNGKEVVVPQYHKIYDYYIHHIDGAMVLKNNLFGFIDSKGKEIVRPQYDKIYDYNINHINWAMVLKDDLYGFIDSNGKEVVVPQYDKIYDYNINRSGWAMVLKDDLFGFIDSKGKEIVKPQYNKIYNYNVNHSDWAMVLKGDLYGFINSKGEEVVVPQYDKIYSYYVEHKNWAKVERSGLFGFINNSGEEIVEAMYTKIHEFNNYHKNWALVERDGKLGFLNTKGEEIVSAIYDDIKPFGKDIDDLAMVERNGKRMYIDYDGNEVIPHE